MSFLNEKTSYGIESDFISSITFHISEAWEYSFSLIFVTEIGGSLYDKTQFVRLGDVAMCV